jgi:hypothetical protein
MTKPIVRIYTDAENFIDREMNDEEYAQWQKDNETVEAELAAIQAKAQAKAAAESKLAALGLTTQDLRALGL